jgi:hypothetical protein
MAKPTQRKITFSKRKTVACHFYSITKMISKIRKFYICSSIYVQTTLLIVIGFNTTLFFIFLLRDSFRENLISEQYDTVDLYLSYPEKNDTVIDELLHETWSRGFKYEAFTQFSEKEFKGKFVNVNGTGIRSNGTLQAWPPNTKKYNIFVFGGSTTFGYGVADDETIPFFLQKNLSEYKDKGDIVVYNFGRGFYYSTQEKILFESLLSKNILCDLAIFIDGLNEFIHKKNEPIYTSYLNEIFLQKQETSIITSCNHIIANTSIGRAQRFLSKFIFSLVPKKENNELKVVPFEEHSAILKNYFFNKRVIEQIAKLFQINTLFVWQPIPSYKYDQSFHPFARDGYNIHEQSSLGYSNFENNYLKEHNSVNFLWLANIQEDQKSHLYVDLIHYSANFNKLISQNISNYIVRYFL